MIAVGFGERYGQIKEAGSWSVKRAFVLFTTIGSNAGKQSMYVSTGEVSVRTRRGFDFSGKGDERRRGQMMAEELGEAWSKGFLGRLYVIITTGNEAAEDVESQCCCH
jgi:hypothetical protein